MLQLTRASGVGKHQLALARCALRSSSQAQISSARACFVGDAAVEALDRDPSMPSPIRFRTHDEHQGEIQVYLRSLLFGDYSVDRGRHPAERLLQVRDGIAALIAANDVTAVGALPVRASKCTGPFAHRFR